MAITDALVLPADVILVPANELSSEVRKQCGAEDTDFAVTRPRSRMPSRIVDEDTAALLGEFRKPTTIVDAVVKYCKSYELDAEKTLEEAFPVLARLMQSGILVAPDSDVAKRIAACFQGGDRLSDFEILDCVQVLEDSELYHARAGNGEPVAVKIARPGHEKYLRSLFSNEATVLGLLEGTIAPKLITEVEVEGRPMLAMEWIDGVAATVKAHELRREYGLSTEGRRRLIELCIAILDVYAHLHRNGVIHGDVHPRNVLVGPLGAVKIIDFGLARMEGSRLDRITRGGIGYFFEPEYARRRLKRRRPPECTAVGEQYALGALLYLLIRGAHYLEFSAEKAEMMRQISEDEPISFESAGVEWPEVESVLRRALSKAPEERFSSVDEFATTLRGATIDHKTGAATIRVKFEQNEAEALIETAIARYGADSPLLQSGIAAPVCSVNYGMAGVAYGLYRLAGARANPTLLAAADVWAAMAAGRAGESGAFYNSAIQITPETVGRSALYHTATGVHAVQAMVSHAMGDLVSEQSALDAYVAAAREKCDNPDLTLGRAGLLLGCSLLSDLPGRAGWLNRDALLALGEQLSAELWAQFEPMPPVGRRGTLRTLGIAHGWAGILYALLRWRVSVNQPSPPDVERRLRELAELAEPVGNGARWKVKWRNQARSSSDYMTGWCNGSAGYVFLWVLAHRVFGANEYLDLAEKAAWNAWERASDFDSLCCGLAGCGYALLALFRHTGERTWLERAREIAKRALSATIRSEMPDSLYKGTLGVALLAADIMEPQFASMPLFEPEGWAELDECVRDAPGM